MCRSVHETKHEAQPTSDPAKLNKPAKGTETRRDLKIIWNDPNISHSETKEGLTKHPQNTKHIQACFSAFFRSFQIFQDFPSRRLPMCSLPPVSFSSFSFVPQWCRATAASLRGGSEFWQKPWQQVFYCFLTCLGYICFLFLRHVFTFSGTWHFQGNTVARSC